MKIRMTLLAAVALLPVARSQSALLTWTGPDSDSFYGASVAGAGDVNNDGCDDIIVGADSNSIGAQFAGMARIYSGYDGELLHAFYGTTVWQNYGADVAGLGDVNLDGWDDVVVGADRDNTPGNLGGAAYVHSGKTGAKLFTLHGTQAESFFGADVGCAGDVNADGRPDIVVAAPYEDVTSPSLLSDAGRVRVYSGANGALLLTLQGTSANATFGFSADGAGDVDNDGRDDIVVGILGGLGRVEVRSGLDGHLIFGRNGVGGEAYGYTVSGAGDVNADGFDDVIVGGNQWSNDTGRAEVLLGPAGALKWTFTGDSQKDYFGASVDGVGDVDKDGYGDVIVGGYGFDLFRGFARIFSGRTGGLLYGTLQGDSWEDGFGTSVAGAGDTNGDGWVDVVVGATQSGDFNQGNGYARTYSVLVQAQNLGFGGPGNAQLKMYGSPLSSFGEMDLSLTGAAANRPVMIVAAVGQMPIALKGGVLVPDIATALLVQVATNAQGKLLIPGIPGGNGPLNVHVQCLIQDPAQTYGWAFSNAIRPQFLP